THRRLRIEIEHAQLMTLRANFDGLSNTAFYAFPEVLTTDEYLVHGFNLLPKVFVFDVSSIPPNFPAPIAHGKTTPRLSGTHLGDLDPDQAEFKLTSEPFDVPIRRFNDEPALPVEPSTPGTPPTPNTERDDQSPSPAERFGSRGEFVD